MTRRLLLGMETEYAVGPGVRHEGWDRHRVVDALFTALRASGHAWVPDETGGQGVFLANGARLYLDRGCHPEYATPECEDPRQVVACARAGELLLQELLALAARVTPMAGATVLLRAAVDYSRLGASWGCHESYLHRCDPLILPDHLLPHLVSRVIFAGAGGFQPLGPGLDFTLSPRAWLLTEPVSNNSTSARGIFHTKDERLSGGAWHRMHVICGESLCSDLASVLKLGTTALVLATVESGWRPGFQIQLASPVDALRLIATDPTCRARVHLTSGRRVTAVELQRRYLDAVEACHREGRLPEWADDLCGLWRHTLDALERGDPAGLRGLDWSVKLELYREQTRRHGFDWSALPAWGEVIRRLERAAERLAPGGSADISEALRNPSPFWKEMDRLTPLLREAGITWADARALSRLRHELLETDLRFGQVGPAGIFNQLAARGVLRSEPGRSIPDPRPMVDEPPAGGRARLRGHAVQEVWASGDARRHRAQWTGVTDLGSGRTLDLSDPFGERAAWIGPEEVAAVLARVAGAGR